MPLRNLEERLRTAPTGFGGVRPTDFGGTVASPAEMPGLIAPGDPRRDPNDPWATKGAGPGFTPPRPAAPPTPEPEPQPPTFFERFPTPQEAWKDWLDRMRQFLARQPGEVPNFPGPWGSGGSLTRLEEGQERAASASGRIKAATRGLQPEEGIETFRNLMLL